MKKYIFSVLIALLSLPVIAQQQQSQAKSILDKTAEAFRKAGGVKADFTVKVITDGLIEGVEHGTIQLKGEKFVLKTTDIVTWFDGKTQWSYVERITLYVTKERYEPLYILLQQRAHPTRNAITVTGYQTGQKYADTLFTFDRKQYPSAEIIDLR